MEARLKQIEELTNFIDDSELKIDGILTGFNWTRASVEKNDSIPKDSSFFYRDRVPKVKLDKTLQSSIIREALDVNPEMKLGVPLNLLESRDIPKSHSDETINFTRDEKLAIYKYCVEKTGHFEEEEIKININEVGTTKTEMTFSEIVAHKRNLKRRRMKHRVTKEPPLSHTEEIRRLIDTQMEAFIQYQCQEVVTDKEEGEEERVIIQQRERSRKKHKKEKSRKRSRNRSRSRSRSHKKRKKEKNEKRERERCH